MYITSEALDPRIFWLELPLLSKLYALFLCIVTIYALYSLSRILFRLHSLRELGSSDERHSKLNVLSLLRSTASKIGNLILLTFFFFGLVFSLQISAAFIIIANSKTPGWVFIFQSLSAYFAFSSDVFLILLIIHCARWSVSARIRAAEIRLTLLH